MSADVATARRGRGQPRIGTIVKSTLPDSVIERIDADAAARGITRSAWVREACLRALG